MFLSHWSAQLPHYRLPSSQDAAASDVVIAHGVSALASKRHAAAHAAAAQEELCGVRTAHARTGASLHETQRGLEEAQAEGAALEQRLGRTQLIAQAELEGLRHKAEQVRCPSPSLPHEQNTEGAAVRLPLPATEPAL